MKRNEIIKQLRLANHFTLLEIAERLGVSEGTVQRYESGFIKVIPYEHIETLAELYGVDPGYIMGWEYKKDDMHPIQTLDEEEVKSCFAKTDGLPLDVSFEEIRVVGDVFMAKSMLNAFRREFYEKVKAGKTAVAAPQRVKNGAPIGKR